MTIDQQVFEKPRALPRERQKCTLSLTKATVAAVFLLALGVGCRAQSADKPDLVNSAGAASQARPDRSLPESFVSVLPEVKAKSHVPVLLPSEPIGKAKHAVVEKATANEYAISLYYELGVGQAGFAASLRAQANPKYHPQDLSNVSEVKLAGGIRGFFRPLSCGGSCAPANLWWELGGVLYQIQLKLSSTLREEEQQKTITATTDSAILAGPR